MLCRSLFLGRFAAQGQMNMLISNLPRYSDSNLSTEILEFFFAKKRSSSVLFIIIFPSINFDAFSEAHLKYGSN